MVYLLKFQSLDSIYILLKYECFYNRGMGEVHGLLFLCVQSHKGIFSPGRESSCIGLQGQLRGEHDIVPEF